MSAFGSAAICEACWIEANGEWDTDNRLLSLRKPALLKEPRIEQCVYCGQPTIFGAYTRVKWADVPHPPPEEAR